MVNEHMKICTLLVIKEMHIITTTRLFTSIRMIKINKDGGKIWTMLSVGEDV